MTALPVLVLHPVTAAAIANGITQFAGLGDIDFTCRSCWGKQGFFVCDACGGSNGRVVPEAGTYVLATTAAADPMEVALDQYRSDAEFVVTDKLFKNGKLQTVVKRDGKRWAEYTRRPEHPSSVLGTVRFEPLPVVDRSAKVGQAEHVLRHDDGRFTLYSPGEGVSNTGSWQPSVTHFEFVPTDISASLPFGGWSGEWCGRFTEFTPTIDGAWRPADVLLGRDFKPRRLACPFPYPAPDRPCFTTIEPGGK